LAKTAEAVVAAIAGEAKLDAHKLRADSSTPPSTTSRTRRSKHVSRTLAPPPARCERCGCQLSRYREENETLCWPCRCGGADNLLTAAEVSAEERERRVALLIAGHSVAQTFAEPSGSPVALKG
jgi:hypothetical protein